MHPMLNIAVTAARQAGDVLTRYADRIERIKVQKKSTHDYVSEVDQRAEQVILYTIKKSYPDHAILAEESGIQEGSEYQWIIDPLDGTTNYLHGFPHYCISIAIAKDGILQHAVIYDPLREELFTATRGCGAQLNDRKLRVSTEIKLENALIGTGFPYRDYHHLDLYMDIFKDLAQNTSGIRRPGSAALDLAYVAAGRIDGFWEFNLAPWDMAAGLLLIQEAGGRTSDPHGKDSPLKTGNIIAGNDKIHETMAKQISAHIKRRNNQG